MYPYLQESRYLIKLSYVQSIVHQQCNAIEHIFQLKTKATNFRFPWLWPSSKNCKQTFWPKMPAVLFPKPVEIPETLRQGGRYKWWFHFFFAEAIISRGCNNMAHWVSNPVKRVQCFGYFAFFLAVPHFAGSYFGLQSGEDTRSEEPNRKSLK